MLGAAAVLLLLGLVLLYGRRCERRRARTRRTAPPTPEVSVAVDDIDGEPAAQEVVNEAEAA